MGLICRAQRHPSASAGSAGLNEHLELHSASTTCFLSAVSQSNCDLAEGDVQLVVDASLALVGLAGFQRRSAHTLSGGERQRLAVAGALAQVGCNPWSKPC